MTENNRERALQLVEHALIQFGWDEHSADVRQSGSVRILDADGDKVFAVPNQTIAVLLRDTGLDSGAYLIDELLRTHQQALDRGFRLGQADGRTQIARTLQQVLGVDEIVAAIKEVE